MKTNYPDLSDLPRFTISVILSYLQLPPPHIFSRSHLDDRFTTNSLLPTQLLLPHNRDAISFLLTTKRYAYAMLPLFRVPKSVARAYHINSIHNDGIMTVVEKYRFVVLPTQDPRTLLDRLNTRRLRARIVRVNRMKKNKSHDLVQCNEMMSCYEYGRSVEELAYEEWSMMKIHHADGRDENGAQGIENYYCKRWRIWPAHLELLQFLDDGDTEQSEDINKEMNGLGREIPSPICFRNEQHQMEEGANGFRGQMFQRGVTLLASYPRSGNTLLRTLLERITSVVTGSDTRPDRTLSRILALDHDLVGEGLVGGVPIKHPSSSRNQDAFDPLVQIVKTHFPERSGWKPLTGNRVLLLIRNPYDAIDSYWNLCCTNTHTRTLDESVYVQYAQKFDELARHEIQIWCDFHYYWMDICEKENVPILIVRYEDLVLDTEAELRRMLRFVLNTEGTLDSFWEWRILHAVSKATANNSAAANNQTSNLGSYKPRSSNGGLSSIGKSVRKNRFSEGVLLHMHEVAVSLALERKQNPMYKMPAPKLETQQTNATLLHRFGYDIYTQQFPEKLKRLDDLPAHEAVGRVCGTVTINRTSEIRRKDDPFGRAMTFWRRGETCDDTVPFPTVRR
ncbi:hypothetical protein ACHAXH_002018 [Discostella pseudostelligera]